MTVMNTDIRNQKIDTINELIQVARDSASFYSDAAGEVSNPKLKALFSDIAASKNGLVGAMSREVREEGAVPAKAGTFRGALHQLYGDVRAKLSDDTGEYAYVSELEASEDRLMDAFHNVLKDDDAAAQVKETLRSYLPTVRTHHDAMRDRKWAMQSQH